MYLVKIDVKLSQTVQNELSLINEDIWLVSQELFAIYMKK